MLDAITIMNVNMLVYGESGFGKTTFIKNLVHGWEIESMGEAFNAEGRTSAEQFRRDPGSMRLETKPIVDRGANRGVVMFIQDMPGWGDEIDFNNSLKMVVRFLLEQRKKDLLENKAGSTGTNPCPGSVMKHGITVCLYFMPPQRAKEMDWYMIEGISSLVAVVPVIAKADTHTAPELEAYRKELLQVVERLSSQAAAAAATGSASSSSSSAVSAPSLLVPFRPYAFDREDLSALRATNALMPPFAVMGSQMFLEPRDSQAGPGSDVAGPGAAETSAEDGTSSTAAGAATGGTTAGPVGVPVRRYLWGDALPLNRDHSDIIILKSLLSGHQNRAVYGLLTDSWKRAHTFHKCWEHLKRIQLEAQIASGQLANTPAAIMGAVEGLEVDVEPMVTEVCQPLQDRLRCEEQQRLAVRLAQALRDIQQLEMQKAKADRDIQRLEMQKAQALKDGQQHRQSKEQLEVRLAQAHKDQAHKDHLAGFLVPALLLVILLVIAHYDST